MSYHLNIGVIKADPYLVAAFDWSLSPRWKQSSNVDRLKFTSSPPPKGLSDDEMLPVLEVPSPAAPGIFAAKVDYLVELGKFDTALFSSYYNPAESIELSLRAWLCGGIVLKQTCSRVAHRNINLFEDTPVGNGAVQGRIDETTLNIAQKWLQGGLSLSNSSTNRIGYDELVFRSRFLQRVPYGVELSIDLMRVTPAQSTEDRDNQIKNSYLHVCLPFDWYLQEVYPGLIIDAKGVNDKYAEYISTDYISPENGYIKKLIAQYTKSSSDVKSDNKEILMLMKREEQLEANIMQVVGAGIATLGHKLPSIKRVFKEPPPIKGTSRAELLDSHMERLKEELTCMDFPEPDHRNVCLKAINDNSEWCETNKADAIFVCPKSCGFCAIEDGKFCEDFYLRKCPVWKAHDQCETIDNEFGLVKDVCRKSCGVCTPHYLSTGGSSNNNNNNKDGDNKDAVGEGGGGGKDVKVIEKADTRVLISPPAPAVKPLSDLEKQQLKIDEMLKGPITVDPALLHTEYLNGNIPDVIDGTGTVADENSVNCRLRNKDDGKILDRITVADIKTSADSQGNNPPPVKIFCGIYTMEQSHATNAKATRNTWAKKCDGFIAFSTVDDPSFPSVNILHEGDEAYDNMWQKSRSIWKYIHAFLVDQYDFFLLGGDDMMYVIENLRAYLGSEEISRSRAERSGKGVMERDM